MGQAVISHSVKRVAPVALQRLKHNQVLLAAGIPKGPRTHGPMDPDWEKINQLQSAVDNIRESFQSELNSSSSFQGEFEPSFQTSADVPEIQNDELLDLAEDLLESSLSITCETFWQHVTGCSGRQWQAALNRLQKLLSAHEALLRTISPSSEARLISAHRVAFRVAFTSTWPLQVAENLKDYFQKTWDQSFRGAPDQSQTEWWCAGLIGPVPRVLALLESREDHPGNLGVERQADKIPATSIDEDVVMGLAEEEEEAEAEDVDEDMENDLTGLSMVSKAMHSLGLQAPWVDLAKSFFTAKVAQLLEERCRSEYQENLLDRLIRLFYSAMLRWLRGIFGLPLWAPSQANAQEESWLLLARGALLRFFEAFLEVRLGEAFDMVRDFPDSAPALLDLRRCLARTGRFSPLVIALREQIGKRLLIAGAHTRDVIKVYIKTIKALRLVDPRGLLLEGVSTPIREYLKKRKDTVRCIITALTEDSDLQEELQLGAEEASKAKLQAGQAPHEPPDLAGEDFEASDLTITRIPDTSQISFSWGVLRFDVESKVMMKRIQMRGFLTLLMRIRSH